MSTEVLMPKLSDTMEEGRIIKWLKHPGDAVKSGDLLAEVETDKANMEIESFDEGVVSELKVAEGESAPVGAVIAVLGGDGEAATAKRAPETPAPAPTGDAPPAAKPAPARAEARAERATKTEQVAETGASSTTVSNGEDAGGGMQTGVKASPLARKIASERGVDLATVRGTGPGGRIVQKDVEDAGGAPAKAPAAEARSVASAGRREFSRIRKTTAKRMADAKRDVPHFYVSGDLAMDEMVRLREALAARGGDFEGITITHLLVKACGLALRRIPEMNASFDVDGIVVHAHVNVGIAAATDEGLLVPVVHDVDRVALGELVKAARAAIARARNGKPTGDDLSGGTFTVSNLGMFPVSHFAAVVNPPQAAILSVGTTRDVAVVRVGAVVPGKLMTVTLSCDHRVVDGALAGRFLAELKTLIEQPLALVL